MGLAKAGFKEIAPEPLDDSDLKPKRKRELFATVMKLSSEARGEILAKMAADSGHEGQEPDGCDVCQMIKRHQAKEKKQGE